MAGILKNPRHEQFAQMIAKGVNQTEAAKAAGYSERTACEQGSRLFRNVQVKARVDELRNRSTEQAISTTGISKAWVMERLVYIIEQTTGTKLQGSVANRALELVGKELGMFQDVIPRQVFDLMMAQMGDAVAQHVQDSATLERIIKAWEQISVADPRKLRSAETDDSRLN